MQSGKQRHFHSLMAADMLMERFDRKVQLLVTQNSNAAKYNWDCGVKPYRSVPPRIKQCGQLLGKRRRRRTRREKEIRERDQREIVKFSLHVFQLESKEIKSQCWYTTLFAITQKATRFLYQKFCCSARLPHHPGDLLDVVMMPYRESRVFFISPPNHSPVCFYKREKKCQFCLCFVFSL